MRAMDFFCHTVDVDVRVYEKLEAVQSSIALGSTRRFGVLLMLRAVVLLIVTSQFKWKQVPSVS